MKSVFEACPRGDTAKPSPVGVPTHYDVRAAVFADSEATSSSMVLEVKQVSCLCSTPAEIWTDEKFVVLFLLLWMYRYR